MVKFFIQKPEKCTICGEEKKVFKKMRQGMTQFIYCKSCYDDYYKKIEGRVLSQVQEMVKSGHQIGMKEALDITKQITAEVEAEQTAQPVWPVEEGVTNEK